MKSIGGRIYLELPDLLVAGISKATVLSAKHRGTNGWDFIADPEDKRRILVVYGTELKPEVKAKVDCALADELAALKARAQEHHLDVVKAMAIVHPSDLHALRAFTFGEPAQHLPKEHLHMYARACAYLRILNNTTKATYKELGCTNAAEWHARVIECIVSERLDLPRSYTKLRERVRQFNAEGVYSVVSKRFGNQNRRLIGTEVNAWLVSQYALPTKPDVMKVVARYITEAKAKGWPALTPSAIYHHLHKRPEVMQQWYLGRHGAAAWKAKYGHTLKTRPASCRDALWIGDGTKLNLYYRNGSGMDASTQMYIVIDAFSHAILGWSIGARENMPMQYAAAKMALTYAQAKPMQWLYDGQSGHTSGAGADFYTRASKLHFASQPYNPKGKPIERIIGEFQKQVMREHWAFTGQNITAKKLDSRPNMEFIKAHKDKLPTLEQLPIILERMVNTWNQGKHAKLDSSRLAAYDASTNPGHQELDPMDMVELFWVRSLPITYRKHGIDITINEARYTFEVYDKDGNPDEAFRRRYINARFVVRYDPEVLDFVCLYTVDANEDLRFVAVAQPKQTVARAVVDLLPGDRSRINFSLELRNREVERLRGELDELINISGVDPEMLIEMAAVGGAGKDDTNRAETHLQLLAQPKALPAEDDENDPGISPFDI